MILFKKPIIKFITAILCLVVITRFTSADSTAVNFAPPSNANEPTCKSIFKVSDYCGYGDGILFDDLGLILTLRAFALKPRSVRIWLDDSTKVEGKLETSDYRSNLAIVRINPDLIEGLPIVDIPKKTAPFSDNDTLYLQSSQSVGGAEYLKLFPIADSLLYCPVYHNENIAGNPIFDSHSELFSLATKAFKNEAGDSLFISFVDPQSIMAMVHKSRMSAAAPVPPSAQKMPLPPETRYTISQLENWQYNPKKDESFYFFKQSDKKQNFKVKIFTPTFFYHYFHLDTLMAGDHTEQLFIGEHADSAINETISHTLAYELFDNGTFSPVVIVVVEPILKKVSKREIYTEYGNYLGSYPEAKKKWQEQKALLEDYFLTVDSVEQPEIDKIFLKDIPVKTFVKTKSYFWSSRSTGPAFHGGSAANEVIEEVTVGVLIMPYEVFASAEAGDPVFAINITSFDFPDNPDVITIPSKTIEKIKADFRFMRESKKK